MSQGLHDASEEPTETLPTSDPKLHKDLDHRAACSTGIGGSAAISAQPTLEGHGHHMDTKSGMKGECTSGGEHTQARGSSSSPPPRVPCQSHGSVHRLAALSGALSTWAWLCPPWCRRRHEADAQQGGQYLLTAADNDSGGDPPCPRRKMSRSASLAPAPCEDAMSSRWSFWGPLGEGRQREASTTAAAAAAAAASAAATAT